MANRQKYLLSQLWILSWGASVQRASLFKKDAIENQRQKLRQTIIAYVEEKLIPQYSEGVSERKHISNISKLSAHGSKNGKSVLLKDGYKFGVAQKLLNLQLKYLWCLGMIAEPPHCPVDRIIIGKTKLRNSIAWTKIVDPAEYREVISAIRDVATKEGKSIARWELDAYVRTDA